MRRFVFLTLIIFSIPAFADDAKMQQLEDDYTNLAKFVMKLSEKVESLEQRVNQNSVPLTKEKAASHTPPVVNNEKWKNKATWNRLNNGMTTHEIVEILGEPTTSRIMSGSSKEFIYGKGIDSGSVYITGEKLYSTSPPNF
jgi:hypothetical protein